MGEIVVHGMVMKGYLDDKEEMKKFFKGGWFHSEDIAVWHPEGYIEIRNCAKEVIISGGESVSA